VVLVDKGVGWRISGVISGDANREATAHPKTDRRAFLSKQHPTHRIFLSPENSTESSILFPSRTSFVRTYFLLQRAGTFRLPVYSPLPVCGPAVKSASSRCRDALPCIRFAFPLSRELSVLTSHLPFHKRCAHHLHGHQAGSLDSSHLFSRCLRTALVRFITFFSAIPHAFAGRSNASRNFAEQSRRL
jgi:hypothetical protein